MWKKVWTRTFWFAFHLFLTEMKLYPGGLGGASVEVSCKPDSISLGDIININVLYSIDVDRPTDLHFDLLQEPEKVWLAGNQVELDKNNGSLSINLTVPHTIEDVSQLLWKVFITPRGQGFPNMLAETGIAVKIGETSHHLCPSVPTESNIVANNDIDYIWIQSINAYSITINYALRSLPAAIIHINLIDNDVNEWLTGLPGIEVKKTSSVHKTILLPTGFWSLFSDNYIEAVLLPNGKTWDDRLAQDRVYLTDFVN